MRISEIFYSLQGEGRLVGTPSLFIRTSGCNLRCVWCDTPYTSWRPEGASWSLEKILRRLEENPARHVVITGGEPMLCREIEALTSALKLRDRHVTIESAGTVFKPVRCDLMSLSPKLANSTPWKKQNGRFAAMHERRRLNLSVLRKFLDRYDYQLKFVVDRPDDFGEIDEIVQSLGNVEPARVLVMAQGVTRQQLEDKRSWIVPACLEHGYSYTPRLHIELFGNRRGT